MATDDMNEKLADKLDAAMDRARETFTDLWSERAAAGGNPMGEADKRQMEKLFSGVVYGHVVAELAALVAYGIFADLKDPRILGEITPSLLEGFESKAEHMPPTVQKKIEGLNGVAGDMLEATAEKDPLVRALLTDIANAHDSAPLRVSFDAIVLGLLGR